MQAKQTCMLSCTIDCTGRPFSHLHLTTPLTPLTIRASSWSPALLLLLLVSSCQALTSAVVILPREYLDPYYAAAAAVDLLQTSSPWPASCM